MRTGWWLVLFLIFGVVGVVNMGLICEDARSAEIWIFHIFGIDVFAAMATPFLLLIAAAYCLYGFARLRKEAMKKEKRL
jgi:hypothetical protein